MDRASYALRLVEEGTPFFLSRQRRFGKSPFLDSLKELFEGSRDLFEGLYAYDRWDWSDVDPVIRLSFGARRFVDAGDLQADRNAQLDAIGEKTGAVARYDSGPERFRHLIGVLHRGTGRRVVVLVDEYDKPILDALRKPPLARANRDYLQSIYSTIKDSDAHIHFCVLTGVSKSAEVPRAESTEPGAEQRPPVSICWKPGMRRASNRRSARSSLASLTNGTLAAR